jgi:hypothetical protein
MSADLIVVGHSSAHGFGRWLKEDAAKKLLIVLILLARFWLSKGGNV